MSGLYLGFDRKLTPALGRFGYLASGSLRRSPSRPVVAKMFSTQQPWQHDGSRDPSEIGHRDLIFDRALVGRASTLANTSRAGEDLSDDRGDRLPGRAP